MVAGRVGHNDDRILRGAGCGRERRDDVRARSTVAVAGSGARRGRYRRGRRDASRRCRRRRRRRYRRFFRGRRGADHHARVHRGHRC